MHATTHYLEFLTGQLLTSCLLWLKYAGSFPINTTILCWKFFLLRWHYALFSSPYYADNYAGLIDVGLATSIQKHTCLSIKHPRMDADFLSRQFHKLCHTIQLLASPFTLVASLHINFKQCIQ